MQRTPTQRAEDIWRHVVLHRAGQVWHMLLALTVRLWHGLAPLAASLGRGALRLAVSLGHGLKPWTARLSRAAARQTQTLLVRVRRPQGRPALTPPSQAMLPPGVPAPTMTATSTGTETPAEATSATEAGGKAIGGGQAQKAAPRRGRSSAPGTRKPRGG